MINFETNFIQPLLLDIQNGEIPDADTFAAKIAEYYEQTIVQGQPSAIPAQLLSPTLTSAANGVPTNAIISSGQDNYKKPNSYNSQLNMYRMLARYYVGKEILAGQQDLEQTVDTLAGIVRKQSFNVQRVKVFIEEAKQIKKQLQELPATLKNVELLIKEVVAEYRNLLKEAKDELDSDDFKQAALEAGVESLPKLFAEEITIIDTVTNLKFDNVQDLGSTINIISDYLKKVTYLSQSPQDRLKSLMIRRIKTIVQRILEAATALVTPRKIGSLLARLTTDKAEVQTRINDALAAYKRFKALEDELRPRLVELERLIQEEKEKAKKILKNKIEIIKEKISVKQQKIAENRRKKQALRVSRRPPKSPKKELFKKAKDDIKAFKENNVENVKILKRKIKTVNSIIQQGNNMIRGAVALKDKIIEVEIPALTAKINEATGSFVEYFGDGNTAGSIVIAATAASASAAQKMGEISSSFNSIGNASNAIQSTAAISKTVDTLPFKKAEIKSTETAAIKRYFEERGLGPIAEPFVLLATNSKKTYQDYRVFLETTEDRYEEYYEEIRGYKPKLQKLIEDFKTLNDEKIFVEPADMTSDSRQERYDAWLLRQRKRKNNQLIRDIKRDFKPKSKQTIISVLQSIEKFIQKIYNWLVKVVDRLKEFIKRQIKNAKKLAEQIKIATIAALPIPAQVADGATREEAAREKLNEIKKYKKKLANGRARGEAIAMVSRAAGPLLTNVSTGKLRASENEKWLKQVAEGQFKYNTVGLKPDSPAYTKAEAERQAFKDNITSMYILEKYVDLILTTYKAVSESKNKVKERITQDGVEYGLGFIDDLVAAAHQISSKAGKRPDGSIGAISDATSNKLVSTIIDLFTGEDPTFESIISKLKRIYRELNGKVFSSLLQSVDYTQAFIDVEQKYLYDVQKVVRQIVGSLEVDETETKEREKQIADIDAKIAAINAQMGPMVDAILSGAQTPDIAKIEQLNQERAALQEQKKKVTQRPIQSKDARAVAEIEKIAKQKAKQQTEQAKKSLQKFNVKGFNFYEEMKRLDRTITKRQGSFLAALIDRLMWQLNYVEQQMRKRIKEWIDTKKTEVKEYLKKIAKENEEALAKIKKRLANADAVILTSVMGLSARMFWTGATWVNSQGTTFQVLNIGTFPKLQKNGLVDGSEAVVREIAGNFEKQLNLMVGQAFPSPAYGIPPFVFNGYK